MRRDRYLEAGTSLDVVMTMRILITTLLLCGYTAVCQAVEGITLEWEANPGWIDSGNDSTYMELDFGDGDGTLKRRIGVRLLDHGEAIVEVWDTPSARTVNTSVPLDQQPIAKITGMATAYAAPWQPSTTYALGDKISVGDYPSAKWWMEATRAGTSGSSEPEWPYGHQFTLALETTLTATDAVDNGDGTVAIGAGHTLFQADESVTISGTVNYDGVYTLPDQSTAGDNEVIITATFAAETFTGTETIRRTIGVVADNGDGTVDIPCPGHGYTGGESVDISGTTNYDGSYSLAAQADPDILTITATYVSEVIAGGSVIAPVVEDPDTGGVQWTFTTGDLATGVSESTGRVIGRLRNGRISKGAGRVSLGPGATVRNGP